MPSSTVAVCGGTSFFPRFMLLNQSSTTDHGQTRMPSPMTPSGGGKRPGPRLPSTRSRTGSPVRRRAGLCR